MKVDTRKRKKARKGFREIYGNEDLTTRMIHVIQMGKRGPDSLIMEIGYPMLCCFYRYDP